MRVPERLLSRLVLLRQLLCALLECPLSCPWEPASEEGDPAGAWLALPSQLPKPGGGAAPVDGGAGGPS